MKLMHGLVTLLLLLWLPGVCSAGELQLAPREVINGGVAVLRWVGSPPDFAVVRFADRVIYFYPDHAGAVALLPVPLEMVAGTYPLPGVVVEEGGKTLPFELELLVSQLERPRESLTLPDRMVSPRDPADLARIKRESSLLNALFEQRGTRLWDRFERPVDDPVSSVFGKRRLLNGEPRAPHSGTDFRSPLGTPVRALSSGRIVLAQDLFYTGQTIVMDHGEGLFSVYAHLSSRDVQVGAVIQTGEVIGRVGSTGRSTGPHLHLTLRLLGTRVDPMLFLETLQQQDP